MTTGNSGASGNVLTPLRSHTGDVGSFFKLTGGRGASAGVSFSAGPATTAPRQPGAAATAVAVSNVEGVLVDTASSSTVPAGAMSWPTIARARGVPATWFSRSTICEGGDASAKS